MVSKREFVIAAVVVSLVSGACFARMRRGWSFEELMAKADLVVIAEVDTSRITGERWRDSRVCQGRTTTFKDVQVLKGAKPKSPLQVLTFDGGDAIPDGPAVVVFRGGDRERAVRGSQYLMFLAKADEGRYEPVSGRLDPDFSIKLVKAAD
jgi:hypothetical protein